MRDWTPILVVAASVALATAWFYVATGGLYNGILTLENVLMGVTIALVCLAYLVGYNRAWSR